MGKFSIIADISNKVVDMLVEELVPELVSDRNGIALCSPEDRGDISLGIYLYDIRESAEIKYSGMINSGVTKQKYPPKILSLYYMITAYSTSDLKFRNIQEQKILGRTMQILADKNVIDSKECGNDILNMNMRLEFLDLETEEKMKLWTNHSIPYKTSAFYRITPIELESLKMREITRVTEFSVTFEENKEE